MGVRKRWITVRLTSQEYDMLHSAVRFERLACISSEERRRLERLSEHLDASMRESARVNEQAS